MIKGSEPQIFLISANQLQNELLIYFITSKIGANCTAVASLGSVPRRVDDALHKRLVLYDFSNMSESVEALIASDTENIVESDYLVLINLSHSSNIEIEGLHYGVRGFLYHEGGVEILLKMIRAVFNSELWVPREIISELMLIDRLKTKPKSTNSAVNLSQREVEILKGIVQGLTNAMIADNCCLSPHTVKTHIHHIFKKINVANRLQAAQWASNHL